MYGQAHILSGVLGAIAAGVVGGARGGVLGATAPEGTLPFTGVSLFWWVLLAATLILVGASLLRARYALRRLRRSDLPECVPAENREERQSISR